MCYRGRTAASRTTRPIRSSRRTARTSSSAWSQEKADIGIAWDGDADRCFFIDGTGEFISGDFITALLAEAFLMKHPGRDDRLRPARELCRQGHGARGYGGTALMNRVGHAFIKRTMREEDGIFGGEVTGHYYFRDNFYADNGFIPALLMLELMSKKGQSLAELLAPLRAKYFISGEINTKVASMDVVDEKLDGLDRAVRGRDASRSSMACRSSTATGTSTCAPSNTEPLLRLNLEATTPELMEAEARRSAGVHPRN